MKCCISGGNIIRILFLLTELFKFEIQKCGQILCAHKPYFLMPGHKCVTHKNIISLNNCVFHSITSLDQPAAVVQVVLSHDNKVISFNNCTFKNIYAKLVVLIQISQNMDFACRVILVNQTATFSSRLFFKKGQLISNKGQILLVKGIRNKKLNISMIGPIKIERNWSGIDVFNDLIVFENVVVYVH